MIFNQEKTLVAWNKDILDTYHDVIVSFDYARYSFNEQPRGGFCVVFFESNEEVPSLGGPGYSLGYTPSNQTDYCYIKGYNGFIGGLLGIGFDLNGEFGLSNELVDGLQKPISNSCTIRGRFDEDYKHIATSNNLFYGNKSFLVAEQIANESQIKFKTVRVIVSKAFTNVEVQMKNSEDRVYTTILTAKIPQKFRTGVKVGVTNTSFNTFTNFDIKNFNVAGFPGAVLEPELSDCANVLNLNTKMQGHCMVSSTDFVAVPVDGGVTVYEVRGGKLSPKQIIEESDPVYLLGGNDKFLFLNPYNTDEVAVYYKASNFFIKTQTLALSSDINDIPVGLIGDSPFCAATDNRNLAIGNKKNVYIYQFFTGSSAFGTFSFIQSITDNISGNIGYAVQLDTGKLLTSGGTPRLDGRYNSFVSFYTFNGVDWNDQPAQTFVSPNSANLYNEFGYSISMQGNEAIIGSPNEERRGKTTLGHGEAYHYVYLRSRRQWRPAMGIGNIYSIDTPGGNFGTSISFLGNNLIISAPYENYLFPPDLIFENKPNTGRVYIFRKNRGGTFSQSAAIAPDFERAQANMLFGRYVGLLGSRTAVVGVPYKNPLISSELDSYKVGCIFPLPPEHKPIFLDSIALYDTGGYQIDIETFTYLKLINYDQL